MAKSQKEEEKFQEEILTKYEPREAPANNIVIVNQNASRWLVG